MSRILLIACIVESAALKLHSSRAKHGGDVEQTPGQPSVPFTYMNHGVACSEQIMRQGNSVNRNHTHVFTTSDRNDETGLAWEITKQYCKKWRYKCRHFSRQVSNHTYGSHYDRYLILQNILQDKHVRTVLWMDDDSFVYDFNTPIEAWLDKYPGRDVIMGLLPSRPHSELQPNSGVMLFQNTEFTRRFINDILHDEVCKRWWREGDQVCIRSLFASKPEYAFRDFNPLQDHFALIPSPTFNCQNEAIHDVGGYCDPWIYHTHGNKKCLIPFAAKFAQMGCSKIDFHGAHCR